jgi:hypothetical protein
MSHHESEDSYHGSSSDDEWEGYADAAPGDGGGDGDGAGRHVKEVDYSGQDIGDDEKASVPILFKFPDGSTLERSYPMGQTIAYIKGNLEDLRSDAAYDKTTLKLDGKMLIDPLSLNDLPFKADEVNVVEVVIADA